MRDLRSLLAVLREPVGAVEPAPRLEDLREVVDGVLAARQPLSSSIYLDRAAQADEVLSRAVYRIVQESLTNARKHSPGTSVQLRVEGVRTPASTSPAPTGSLGPSRRLTMRRLPRQRPVRRLRPRALTEAQRQDLESSSATPRAARACAAWPNERQSAAARSTPAPTARAGSS